MSRSLTVATAAAVLLVAAVPVARQNPPGQTPVFRSSVDIVHLDVSVLDRDRRPVRGLTAEDFTVFEDGAPQDIAAFLAVDVPENPPAPAAWSGRAPLDVQTNVGAQDPEGRLFVVLIDDAMIPPHQGSLETAREVARKFIGKVTPSDRVAVVFSATGRNQDFTNDRARLLQAVNSLVSGHATHLGGWDTALDPATPAETQLQAGPAGPMSDPDMQFRMASLRTLREVAETLISAPQRRKALLFISPGVEVDAASAAIQTKPGLMSRASMRDANQQLLRDMPELFRRMKHANVTIYPVDPCGAGGFAGYLLNAASGLLALRVTSEQMDAGLALPAFYDWLDPGSTPPPPVELVRHMSTLNEEFLETAAQETGGLALVNTNDFDGGIDRIFLENSSYYLIGYQQPAGHKPGSLHRLSVRVNRPDVIVRTRSAYDIPDEKAARPASPLDRAIAAAVPEGAFPMRVAFAPFAVPGTDKPLVTMVLGLEQPPVKTRTNYLVDIQTNVYTMDGRPVKTGQRHRANVVLVPTSAGVDARYDLLSTLSLAPGRYQVRLSAFRELDGVVGSLYADVEVPDFSADLAVSGGIVEAIPAGATAPPAAFDAFLPVVPTSSRTFRPGQDVTVFFRIYQGGKRSAAPVEVKTRMVNEFDAAVGDGRDIVYGNEFHVGGRAADYRFAIPVKALPPGLYLLTFDFGLGDTTVTRSVQFRVAE